MHEATDIYYTGEKKNYTQNNVHHLLFPLVVK